MIRNFVTGIVVGGVVAGAGLGVVSQLTPLPQGRVQVAADQAKPVAVAPEAAVVVKPELTKPAVVKPGPKDAPVMTAPTVETTAPVQKPTPAEMTAPAATTVPPKTPVPVETTTPAAAELVAPPAKSVAEVPRALPVPSQAEAAVPAAPKPSTELPVKPPLASVEAPAALNESSSAAAAPQVQAAAEAAPTPAIPGALAGDIATDAAPAPADLPPPAPQEAAETLLTPAPAPAEPTPPSMLVLDPAPEPAPGVPEPVPEVAAPELPKVLDTSQPETLAPSVGLTKSVDGVTVGRLPSIAEPAPPADPATAAEAVPAADTRPIAQYAAEFSNDLGKPLFAVLLVDSGAADLDRAKLAALPFPVSFVIDPLDPSAAAAEATYRAAGKEVVMLAAGIPAGATAGDLEQTFQANAGVLPESVAVMDIGAAGFQDNRPLATMVVPILKDQGRGLVTFDAGLNAADQVARREDVAAAVIFRDLDGAGEDTPLIRRYLDRAAFKAAQEGRVVVVGTTRPETIAALMEWTLEGKGASVALAPISAVLAVQ
ncbi:MAG: divergent polysaccharide deacetylase family protein [Pseudomonadota bacterium]